MNTVETAQPPADDYPLARRVVGVFVEPGRVFEFFRVHTPWVGPLLLAGAAGLVVILLIPSEMYVEQATEAVRRAGEAGAAMPDPETMATIARLAGAASILVMTPIMAFAAAGVMALLFSILGGGEARYRQYLAVTTHTMLITALGGLVTLGVQVLRGDLQARLSIALLFPFLEEGGFAFRLLNGLDVFSLWALVVAALGVSVINRGWRWPAATAVLLGLFVAVLAAVAALASAR